MAEPEPAETDWRDTCIILCGMIEGWAARVEQLNIPLPDTLRLIRDMRATSRPLARRLGVLLGLPDADSGESPGEQ